VRRVWPWLAALVPALLGLAAGVWLGGGQAANPIVVMRGPLGAWLSRLGLLVSLLILGALAIGAWQARRDQRRMASLQAQAASDRRRFLQRLDHELKNPLTAIRAGLANVAEAPSPQTAHSVDAQVLRLSRLTADLRKLAELETRPLERSEVDLNELLTQVFELAQDRPEAETRRLNLILPQAPWPLPRISGDRDLLLLAIHNLLDNALKFSRPADHVELRASEDGASVVVEVADTGPGIPDEDLPHIWEELYRGKGARGIPGSGLGLALVHAIVLRHGGQVTLRSRAGQGTVFTVRLPIK
jgi:two-component system OmpR family sensor kinase